MKSACGTRHSRFFVPCPLLGRGLTDCDPAGAARRGNRTLSDLRGRARPRHLVPQDREAGPRRRIPEAPAPVRHLFRGGDEDPRVKRLQAICDAHIAEYGLLADDGDDE